jgi:hypothetical protein
MDYKKLYFEMFNKISVLIQELQKVQTDMEQKVIADESNEESQD